MAFSFGSTTTPAFGSTPQKPTGFATPFGASAPTTQSTGFGFGQSQPAPAFGSTFGAAPTSAPPSFGASTFGAPASSAAPAFGSSFGAPTSNAAPAFGAQTQSTGLFGTATTKPSLFGTPATSTTNMFGNVPTSAPSLFGTVQTTQSAPSLFGNAGVGTSSLFGQPAAQQPTTAPTLFGSSFGQTTTSAAGTGPFGGGSLFGGAAQQSTQQPSLFGTSTFGTSTAGTGFGGFGTGTTGAFGTGTTGAFGTGTTGAFGTGASTGGFGGFGTQSGGMFGAKPPQQAALQPAQQTPQNKNQQVIASVYAINVFNDERDDILKKWNMLQACWGTGKGYYNSSQPPVEYTPQNPFYRFKAMGYNVIPEQDNSEGLVKLVFNKKIAELRNQQDVLKNGIGGILGNRPNLTVDIVLVKAISDNQTEVKICVSEKGVTGTNRKIPATDLAAFLNQPTQKQQLTNVGVSAITPFVTPSKAELEEYLKQPPPGIDLQMWQAAVQDNPNPKKYIPVPINGFSDLRARMLNQEYQTGLHSAFIEKVNKDITELKTKHSNSIAQISELKQKFLELQHRILRVLVKQESTRKVGLAIQPEEEILRGRLEVMHAQLNVPKQFKGQINELLSHVKMIENTSHQSDNNYRIDADAQEEIKQFLKMEQNGISQLINIINSDAKSLKIISEGLKELVERRHFS